MSDTQIQGPPPTVLLKAANQRLRELFERFDALSPDEGGERRAAFRAIRDALKVHMDLEEALLYPAILGWESESARKVVDQALEGHRRTQELLDEAVLAGAIDAPSDELRSLVLEHLQLEEEQVFPHVRRLPFENQWELSRDLDRLRSHLEDR